ncbi:hypothetical protein KIL84_001294 [Mauremys mutica]|uniref:Testican-2 n=1 Tax=Mauremys mutica TaxID=74926 RepID=A0A9D4ATZ5_9SAUR|nr:hypothetical protein KIL84_001294 [Mauremys mutica]
MVELLPSSKCKLHCSQQTFFLKPGFVNKKMLKVAAFMCVCAAAWYSQGLAAAAAAAGGRSDPGNFLDDKQWLTTVSQYDKEVGQWNKFRDMLHVSEEILKCYVNIIGLSTVVDNAKQLIS